MNIGDMASGFLGILVMLALLVAGCALYFAPTIVAVLERSRNLAAVAIINTFLGWTLLGWVAALAIAVWPDSRREPPRWMPYPYPPQQQWPAQPPMWHTDTAPPAYDYPTYPAAQQTYPHGAPDDQLAQRRRRHML